MVTFCGLNGDNPMEKWWNDEYRFYLLKKKIKLLMDSPKIFSNNSRITLLMVTIWPIWPYGIINQLEV